MNELGELSLILALGLALAQSVIPLITNPGRTNWTADTTSYGIFFFVTLSFATLMYAYATSDFSLVNVYQNSHTKMPFLYKLTGTWGNHEGSMLLWVFILSLFSASVGLFGSSLPKKLKSNVQMVQGWLLSAFLAFIIFTSSPFVRQPPTAEGQDLNPILQDIGLAIHPPMLYLGYVGFAVTFSFAVAALLEGKMTSTWARWFRPWTIASWMFLGGGIALGSYWAYYELGWGGWWFWDPVENASFLPWLSGTALLHCALVTERRGGLKIWTLLLAILTFSLSLLGTFLVRSGVLTSVHTFANDPQRGFFILAILCLFVGGALTLFFVRANKFSDGALFAPISREGALILNNLFLGAAAATVLTGTLYPLAYEAITNDRISVGPPFFNLTFGPLMIALLVILPLGPLLAWKKADLLGVTQRLLFVGGLSLLVLVLALAWNRSGPWLAPLGIGLSVWVMVGSLSEIIERSGIPKNSLSTIFLRFRGLPASVWSTGLAHFGLGVTFLGIVSVTAYETQRAVVLGVGDRVEFEEFVIDHVGVSEESRDNYIQKKFLLRVRLDDRLFFAEPSHRFYPARQSPTTEVSISTFGFSQLYISASDSLRDGVEFRLSWKPLILLIWLGPLFMVFAGLVSLFGRKRGIRLKK